MDMTRFEKIKNMSIDEMAKWLNSISANVTIAREDECCNDCEYWKGENCLIPSNCDCPFDDYEDFRRYLTGVGEL